MWVKGIRGQTRVEIRPSAYTESKNWPSNKGLDHGKPDQGGRQRSVARRKKEPGPQGDPNKNVTMEPYADICAFPFIHFSPMDKAWGRGPRVPLSPRLQVYS